MNIINHTEDNIVCFGALEIGDMFTYPFASNIYYIKMLNISDKVEAVYNSFSLNSSCCVHFGHDTQVLKVKGILHIENI